MRGGKQVGGGGECAGGPGNGQLEDPFILLTSYVIRPIIVIVSLLSFLLHSHFICYIIVSKAAYQPNRVRGGGVGWSTGPCAPTIMPSIWPTPSYSYNLTLLATFFVFFSFRLDCHSGPAPFPPDSPATDPFPCRVESIKDIQRIPPYGQRLY